MGPPEGISALRREQEVACFLHLSLPHGGHSRKASVCKPVRTLIRKLTLQGPHSQTASLQKSEQ